MLHFLFQFPTGWNSTQDHLSQLILIAEFQFPTGWNSTKIVNFIDDKQNAFQFPTGWNSTYKLCFVFDCSIVSIPNGMEFYC